ncbi:MAG TPA: hypothetical protein VHG69_05315 [Thermoleophilaceae bacterium]|nr:hypothetical protein [Thermoleophilaceae bacterium]
MGTSPALPAFSIPRTRTSVVVGVLGLVACLLFALLFGLVGLVPFFDRSEIDAPLVARLIAIAGAAGVAWLGLWILRYSLRSTRGQVRVEEDRLVVEHPDTFKAPLVVPREAIRVAIVDTRGTGRVADDAPIAEQGEYELGWTALPLVASHEGDTPNVGVIFRDPLPAPAVKHARLHGPLPGEALAGIRLRVGDPAGFERSLQAWRCVREPSMADAAHADILLGDWQEDKPPARRALWLNQLARNGWLMAAGIVVFPWLGVLTAAFGLMLAYRRRRSGWLLLLATAAAGSVAFLIR